METAARGLTQRGRGLSSVGFEGGEYESESGIQRGSIALCVAMGGNGSAFADPFPVNLGLELSP